VRCVGVCAPAGNTATAEIKTSANNFLEFKQIIFGSTGRQFLQKIATLISNRFNSKLSVSGEDVNPANAESIGQPIIHILILIRVTLLCTALAMRRLARSG
jgi:hypothetical protein